MCPQWLKDMKQASFINMKKKKKACDAKCMQRAPEQLQITREMVPWSHYSE